jgi:hypothetical protein
MRVLGRFWAPAGLVSLAAGSAQACPVCILADPKTAGTYLDMTLMMSALPLALLGGFVFWLKRRYSPSAGAFRPRLEPHPAAQFVEERRIWLNRLGQTLPDGSRST